MSNRLKIYSLKDFVAADRLSRIRMHIVEPERFILFESEQNYYEKLLKAYHGTFDTFQRTEAVKFIQNTIPDCETWYKANRVYQDSCELFGSFIERNKQLQRLKTVEKLFFYAEQLERDGKWLEASMVLEKAAKIEGLDKAEEQNFNPDDFIFPKMEVSSDPRLLREPQDIDFEEGADDGEN